MTEMVYGSNPVPVTEPVIPRWWRTIDKWTMTSIFVLFGIGLLLGLAASVPLASRNGLEPFYYVQKQAMFGCVGMAAMIAISMMSPETVRRLGVIGFLGALVLVMMLPLVGQDHGKGAIRWLSIGGFSLQPSEFLKPAFVVVTAWLMAAGQQLNGPPGRTLSFLLACIVVGFLAMQPDFGQSALVLFSWGVIYFVAGAPMLLIAGIAGLVATGGFVAYGASEHFARRIDGFLSPDVDPRTQLGYATNAIQEGGFFGVGVGEGQVKWSLPDAHTDFIIAVA
ncbi:MAG: FtsW/RodA/SpoVE family cell cycle protein, partial [Paracoccaceae bacterium]